ncbi:helix-turn-helix domain-containing protein [Planctobacterium marinum]|uniref:helix-turn-helix domain-containing protein n=1 Tax=Planctobacterium marinum TaxID=1631968 RepID=UPI001E2B3DF1|nr:AraC family transcriptional regulator [Planctobacterium marinum]MCC2605092.1 AraC family transcriptional regulator [Planctobacterium marinum]
MNICQRVLSSLTMFNPGFASGPFAPPQHPFNQFSRHQQLVKKTCDYLLSNLDKHLTLASISKAMFTNRNTLSGAFKKEVGQGVAGWLRQQRMEQAMHLLITTELSIQEIAIAVGYPDQANFSTTFKHTFDKNPLQVRRAMRPSG